MSCGPCVKTTIEGTLREIGTKSKVNLESASVTVEYDENNLSLEQIKEVIESMEPKVV